MTAWQAKVGHSCAAKVHRVRQPSQYLSPCSVLMIQPIILISPNGTRQTKAGPLIRSCNVLIGTFYSSWTMWISNQSSHNGCSIFGVKRGCQLHVAPGPRHYS